MQMKKKEVINEANKIYDVEKVIPSIYLVSELVEINFNLIVNYMRRICSD